MRYQCVKNTIQITTAHRQRIIASDSHLSVRPSDGPSDGVTGITDQVGVCDSRYSLISFWEKSQQRTGWEMMTHLDILEMKKKTTKNLLTFFFAHLRVDVFIRSYILRSWRGKSIFLMKRIFFLLSFFMKCLDFFLSFFPLFFFLFFFVSWENFSFSAARSLSLSISAALFTLADFRG